jgi:hypothetical protein
MASIAERPWLPAANPGWKLLGQKCAHPACGAKYPKLNGLLKSGDGIRILDDWYCGPRCFEAAITERFQRSISTAPRARADFQHRMPLGLLMVSRGLITHEQVKAALDLQQSNGEPVGRCLRQVAGVTASEVASAVGQQWSCPVYKGPLHPECLRLIPKRLLEHYGMLPVHYVRASQDLYVGFERRIDHTALYALEQMLGCHTVPCVLEEPTIESGHALVAGNEDRDLVIEHPSSAQEMARVAGSYAHQLRAFDVRVVNCGEYVWLRVFGPRHMADLLFRRQAQSCELQ